MSLRRSRSLIMLGAGVLLGVGVTRTASAQNVGVGTTAPNSSALLHVYELLPRGFLIPRLTNTQMLAISSPATGLLVYNSTQVNFYYYDGTQWVPLVGSGWSLTGDAGTSASVNYLGTQDAQDVVQKTNYRERMRFFSTGDVGLKSNWNVAEQLLFYEPSGTGSAWTSFRATGQSSNVRYRLPLTDGSSGSALVTDGAGNLSWKFFATIGGGGSVTLWNRGGGQRTLESDGVGNQASGKYSIAAGQGNKATGQYSMVFGHDNQGSGQEATVPGGEDNSATGDVATVMGGSTNSSSGNNSTIEGGINNSVSGSYGTILGGNSNTVSGTHSIIINGINNQTSGNDNVIFGNSITVAGSNTVIFRPPGPTETRMGILTTSPTQALHVEANIKFSGALKPANNGGTAGQYLKSTGTGTPTWGTITIPTTNWSLTGNTGSNPSINYIGTSDAQAFVVRTSGAERMRILSSGQVVVGATTGTSQFNSFYSGTTDEVAALYAEASGSTTSQSLGIWGRVNGSGSSNTGTIAVLATGNGNTTAGTTDVALQVADGEFAMGRTTETPSKGTVVGSATAGTAYSDQGPSGVVELSLQTDLPATAPTAGAYQDLGTFTINNRYATSSSIIEANVVSKINGGGNPDPKNSIFKVDVESRAAGSFVLHVGMIPTLTDATSYQGSDLIRIGYVIINPGR